MKKCEVAQRCDLPEKMTWDLQAIYENNQAWEEDFSKLDGKLTAAAAFQGKLAGGAEVLKAAFEAVDDLERLAEKLYVYSHLRTDEDTGNSENRARQDRIEAKFAEISGMMAWFEPEITAFSDELMDSYMKSPELELYHRSLNELWRARKHVLSAVEERMLGILSDALRSPAKIYSTLNNADLTFPKVKGEDGRKIELTHANYSKFLESEKRSVRRGAYQAMYNTYSGIRNTCAATLDGAVSVRQMPEFRRLDVLVAEYLRTFSLDLIPDILVTANAAKDVANRYIVSGNVLRGETMLADLRLRLSRVNVHGTEGIGAVSGAVSAHNLPLTYSPEALAAFADAVREFEQSPALPPEDLAQKLLAAKKALFSDTDMEAMDRDTFSEILEIREEVGEEQPDRGKVENLTELKKELMSFNLSYFVDLSPAVPEEKEAPAASVDTQVILDAIARLGTVPAAPAAAPADQKTEEKIGELSRAHSAANVRKPRALRPAVSARDSKVEKTDQPLRVVKRRIDAGAGNPEALSRQVVEELAVRIANSRIK